MTMPAVRVLYFASVAERTGIREEVYPLPFSLKIAELRQKIAERHPGLAGPLEHCRLALNQEFIEGDPELKDGDEVALIPPVSGG